MSGNEHDIKVTRGLRCPILLYASCLYYALRLMGVCLCRFSWSWWNVTNTCFTTCRGWTLGTCYLHDHVIYNIVIREKHKHTKERTLMFDICYFCDEYKLVSSMFPLDETDDSTSELCVPMCHSCEFEMSEWNIYVTQLCYIVVLHKCFNTWTLSTK